MFLKKAQFTSLSLSSFFLSEDLYKLKAYMRNMTEFEKGFRKMLNFLYNLELNYNITHVNQKSFNIWSETVWSHICLLSPNIEFS